MLEACSFSRSSGHACSFSIQCHRKTLQIQSPDHLYLHRKFFQSRGWGGEQNSELEAYKSLGLSNEGKNCNSKLRRAQKVQSEQLLEISSEPEFTECTAWSHACSCNTPWNATPSLLEIFFFSFFSKDSREVNLNYFKLAKADILDSIIGEAIFKKKMFASK